MGETCAIHTNLQLKHQVINAQALSAGFKRHGIDATVTADRTAQADIHVCLGPWYALKDNINGTIFYLDRALWGDPQSVSLNWLVGGVKQFDWTSKPARSHPALSPLKSGDNTVILCDYGETGSEFLHSYSGANVRRHPSEVTAGESLESCLRSHHRAVGHNTTALVDAAIEGLHVVITGPLGDGLTLGREQWINCLAWHNWTLTELENGDAWSHLYR